MAVKNFACFDLYPTQMQEDGVNPVFGAGILGTPLESFLIPYVGDGKEDQGTVGVSDLVEDQLSLGGQPARSLVITHQATATGLSHCLRLETTRILTEATAEGKSYYRQVVGFAFKDRSDAVGGSGQLRIIANHCRMTGPHGTTLNQRHEWLSIGDNGNFRFRGTDSGRPCAPNQEYYIELVLEVDYTSGRYTYVVGHIYIDGELVSTSELGARLDARGSSSTTIVSSMIELGGSSNVGTRRLCFGHFYQVIKDFDDDPAGAFVDRLGPQKVRPTFPSELVSDGGWTTHGAEDPVEAWSEARAFDDTAFVQSPEDNGELKVKLALPTQANSKVHGIRLFGRSSREGVVARPVEISLALADGTVLGETAILPQGGDPLNNDLMVVGAKTVEDVEHLKPGNLVNAVVTLRSPPTT